MELISIVIPVYNNCESLDDLISRLRSSLADEQWEVIFVDDGSRDNSGEIIKKYTDNNSVKLISLSRNFGQHSATHAGLANASGDYIVIMDADLQDQPEDILLLISKLREKDNSVDVVYTTKTERHDNFFTALTSRVFHYAYSKLTRIESSDQIGTFRAFTRRVCDEVLKYNERNIVYGPLILSMGFQSAFIPVAHKARFAGKSSYNFKKRLELAISTLVRHTDLPHKFFLAFGGTVVAFSLLYSLFCLIQYAIFGRILIGGLMIVILLLLFFMGTLFVSLGLLGLYIFQIFQEVLMRPRYHIKWKINL